MGSMPSDESTAAPIAIRFTPEFRRNLRQLAKKYRHIRSDIQPVLDALAAGQRPGDSIAATDMPLYKVRAPNRDAQRGKSGGYRLIYALASEATILLLTLYSKTEQQDIDASEIQAILREDAPDDQDDTPPTATMPVPES
jgi:mRNA-degrading endonuclease RelE of RelBE toxin-antitoxin system